jgi:hypothetical protein
MVVEQDSVESEPPLVFRNSLMFIILVYVVNYPGLHESTSQVCINIIAFFVAY